MRQWLRPQADLFKTPLLTELPPPQRTAALELLKALLTEVMSAAEPGGDRMGGQEAGDDQDHG
jgi:hypothetical protein